MFTSSLEVHFLAGPDPA